LIDLWDTSTFKLSKTIPASLEGFLPQLSWSPDGKHLASSAGNPGQLRVWDVPEGTEKVVSDKPAEGPFRGIPGQGAPPFAWRPDGGELAFAAEDCTARLWNVAAAKQRRSLSRPRLVTPGPGAMEGLAVVAWSGDGRRLATCAASDRLLTLWDTARGERRQTISGQTATVVSLALTRDGGILAAADRDGNVTVCDTATGRVTRTLANPGRRDTFGRQGQEFRLAWNPAGDRLAVVAPDGSAYVYDPAADRKVLTLLAGKEAIASIAWSPDGKRLATAVDSFQGRHLSIWEAISGDELLTLPAPNRGGGDSSGPVSWSSDGSRLCFGNFVWDAR
jgi:WD40 repeat protein